MDPDVGTAVAAGLPALFGLVLIGSIVLVIPTGAAVSAAAVVAARHTGPFGVLGVVTAGAVGAYVGDLVVYAVCTYGGEQVAARLHWSRGGRVSTSMERISERLARHDVKVLVVGRLLPAGRMPVLVAAGISGYSWRRFALADLAAVLVWSSTYAAIGIAGGSLFPETWQSVLAAVALVLVLSLLARRIRNPALLGPGTGETETAVKPAGAPDGDAPGGATAPTRPHG